MTDLNDLLLKRGERGIIVGRCGTGKSHLASFLLPRQGPLTIIDPKRNYDYPYEAPVYRSMSAIAFRQPERLIYRPTEDDLDNLDAYNQVLKWSYQHAPRMVYLDDLVGVMSAQRYPRYMQIAYQMGRQDNVRCLAATQRPAFVPGFVLSESIKLYIFHLHYPADVKKIQEMVPGYEPDELLENPHAFFFYDHKMRTARRLVMPAKLPDARQLERTR